MARVLEERTLSSYPAFSGNAALAPRRREEVSMKDQNYTIGCITQLTDKGVQQTVDVFGDVITRAVNVQSAQMEEGIRAKLIQLGWTPPASGTDMHTNDDKVSASAATCIDSVPLPEPVAMRSTTSDGKILCEPVYTADQLRAYGDERARVIAEDRNCWKSVAEGEAEFRAIADDELKVSEGRVAELETLLKMIATRAANFPDFPMGWHMPEVFKAVGMQAPEQPENDDTLDGLRACVAELEAKLQGESETVFSLLCLLADIRKAAGDPTGKLMQAELVELISALRCKASLYRQVRRQHWFQIAAAEWVGLHGAKDLSERCRKLDDRIAAIAAGGGDGDAA